MLAKHILDSLSVAKFLPTNGRILDVGSGAGLPGIPLAILYPELSFVLVDSVQKKTAFMQHVVAMLGLVNTVVVHTRVEKYHPELLFDVIISRAFAELGDFVRGSAHLCHQDGFFLAMKGKSEQAQAELLPANYSITQMKTITVPGVDAERCLVFVSKQNNRSN